jgi:hypothetical protein
VPLERLVRHAVWDQDAEELRRPARLLDTFLARLLERPEEVVRALVDDGPLVVLAHSARGGRGPSSATADGESKASLGKGDARRPCRNPGGRG